MFWRLFLTYFLLVVAAVALSLVVMRTDEGPLVFHAQPREVLLAMVGICLLAALPAYILARRFARPLEELTDGAERIAVGDLGHKIRTGGGRDFTTLARAFNGMSERLADTFEQLEHDREQLRTILSGMIEGVIAFDQNERVLFANDRAGVLLEFDPASIVGLKLWEVTRQRGVQEIVETGLASNGPYRRELDWKGPGAKSLAVYVSRLPSSGLQPSPGAVMVLHDTTELRRLEQLRQEFVANVSHELKTPLAVIRSNIEVLQDGAADDPVARVTFLDRAAIEAARLEALILDLLRLARIEAGDRVLEPVEVRLDLAIAECLERQSTRAEAKTLQLIEVPPPDAPRSVAAWVDENAFHHVLDNLVDNAIKYTHNGGRITIRWTATPTHVQVDVQDNGFGISDRDLPRIFERFYRADKARDRAAGGTGLGLSIVKHLVAAMNGQIRVVSTISQGSTFSVTLPRAVGE